jgi:hypothetical protein
MCCWNNLIFVNNKFDCEVIMALVYTYQRSKISKKQRAAREALLKEQRAARKSVQEMNRGDLTSSYTESLNMQRSREHREKYPSVSSVGHNECTKRESQKYTGDLIIGIATMHKSNAVPVMRDTNQAKELASMRR